MKTFSFFILLLFLTSATSKFLKEKELFEDYYPQAEKIVEKMTIEQKIGQMFFPRFSKTNLKENMKKYYPGGFVLFANDFKDSTESIKAFIDETQKYSKEINNDIPLGLSVDEEGGTVCRISIHEDKRKEKFPSPREVYEKEKGKGWENMEIIEKEKIELIKKHGLNLNLAPVADLPYNEQDFIYQRAFSTDLKLTEEYIERDVKIYNDNKFSCCLKHFPGYGNNTDTHTEKAADKRTYDELRNRDMKTFESGIKNGVPTVMITHTTYDNIDTEYPASISEKVHKILREDLKFSGLILTDDITMGAILHFDGPAAKYAVTSGNDVILTSNWEKDYGIVLNATKNGEIDEKIINKACKRIIAWKLKYLGHFGPDESSSSSSSHSSSSSSSHSSSSSSSHSSSPSSSHSTSSSSSIHLGSIVKYFLGLLGLILLLN